MRYRGNNLRIAADGDGGNLLTIPPEIRATHLYVCGSTGTGKSKLLEYFVRQDIAQWHRTKAGLLLLDPHGSLYENLLQWISWNAPHLEDVPIVPIDLRRTDWTVGYNVLRKRSSASTSVIVGNFVQAMTYVWGEDGTDKTPQFARWASNVLWALYEKQKTLIDAEYLVDPLWATPRDRLTQDLADRFTSRQWAYAGLLDPKDLDLRISSSINRLTRFIRNEHLRLMFGQTSASLDLGEAIEKGSIILVNLSTENARMSEEDTSLFATLLLSDLWTAAQERGKGTDQEGVKPFYVYIDEFQNFITPTIAKGLDQARGYGLHLTLANQFPRQILHAGAKGEQVYESVMSNARSKIVFETRGEENLRSLALDLFMGVMDPDEIKLKLHSRKVLDYSEETRTVRGRTKNRSQAVGDFSGTTSTTSHSGQVSMGAPGSADHWNDSEASSFGSSKMGVEGDSFAESEVPFLRPILGEEVSSVQFRTLEEQLFRAMAVLFDQKQRHAVARLVGMKRPMTIVTPSVRKMPADRAMIEEYIQKAFKGLPFMLPAQEARKQIQDRERQFAAELARPAGEPMTTKRRLR